MFQLAVMLWVIFAECARSLVRVLKLEYRQHTLVWGVVTHAQ